MTQTARAALVPFLAVSLAAANSLLGLRYPLGLPIETNSGTSLAMGGASCAASLEHNLMLSNPANLGNVRKTVLSSLFLLDFVNLTDEDNGTESNFARFLPTQISFGFPLGILGSVAIGYEKRDDSRGRYEFTPEDLPSQTEMDSYRMTYARDGGTSAWQAGWGYAIGKWARVGLAYERTYVRMRASSTQQASVGEADSDVFTDSSAIDYRGSTIRAGVQVPFRRFTFGVAARYPFAAEAVLYRGDTAGLAGVRLSSDAYTLQLPPEFTAGVAWQITEKWLAAGDANVVMWKSFETSLPLLSDNVPLRNYATGVGFGAQFVPAPDVLTPKYWETINYRAGARFTQLPAADSWEFGLALGIGLPLPAGGGLFDFTLEYGRRFDRNYEQFTEEFLHVGFGINGGRKWTKSPQSTY